MDSQRKQVLCPVEKKGGKTRWVRMGIAFINRDASINLYLDGLPVNGKLQIRDWDDGPRRGSDSDAEPGSLPLAGMAGEESPF